MNTATIQVLKPNVSEEDALRTLSARGLTSLYWNARSGSLQRIASAYVPFWLYRVRYDMNRASQERLLALDAVNGSLDLFSFPRVPSGDELQALETRNFLEPALSEAEGHRLVGDKVLRVIFQQGFFKLRSKQLDIHREPAEFYMPYWLGFYQGRGPVRCRVLDAVRRRVEGAKASAFFEQWLAA
jgi:hypothetical protein